LFADTGYAGLASLNLRSTVSPWGTFTLIPGTTVKSGTTTLTSASGEFHIQPATDTGCALATANGDCIATGSQPTSTTSVNTKADNTANYPVTMTPSVNRYNFFSNAHYDIDNHMTVYAEAGWYEAESQGLQSPQDGAAGSSTLTIPASNYWNPFGPVTFANGQVNPNRLPNLNIPAGGEPVKIVSYQPADQGTNVNRDWGHQGRILLGAKGDDLFGSGFNWDTGLLYSDAGNRDLGEGINSTAFQANLALSTAAAYNPFLGGNSSNPPGPVTNASNAAALQSFTNYYKTDDYSTLGLWDFKVSKADLFALPGGDLGLASGVEVRHESLSDIRDPNINGTDQFIDSVTGTSIVSNQLGVSQTPSTKGQRWVESVYGELAVPVISPSMGIPLVEKVALQLAGRYENFSDVGGVAKPKVAFSWDVNDSFRIRGSWSQGFQAPNLIVEHATLLSRSNTATDYIFCQADLDAHRINSFANCSEGTSAADERYGNPSLKPETSDNKSIGFVFQPTFVPSEYGEFTLTADYWNILEKNLIGDFGAPNALILDYADRMQGGTNPNVVRATPTSTQIAEFAGTGIAPVGTLQYINDLYVNENPQLASGVDLDAHWSLRDTGWGSFSADLNVARTLGLKLEPSPAQQTLLNDRTAGVINAGTVISGFGNELEQGTNPAIRWNLAPTWTDGPWTLGGMVTYTGGFYDTGLINTANVPFRVPSLMTGNIFGEVAFKDGVIGADSRLRVGVRNVANSAPPPDLALNGFVAGFYEPFGRYEYISFTENL
jgi:outer membrane receptor protein involved in Fe transport